MEAGDALVSPPTPATPVRLWRPAAQRNLRNQWSKLLAAKNSWAPAVSEGRTAATALVNAYLSQRYLPMIHLGVVKDMPDILSKASEKLSRQQELYRTQLLSSYKAMVDIISDMIKASASMRCFITGSRNSSLIQFSNYSEDKSDSGDGGGISVFSTWSISSFEEVAQELVNMFDSELNFKRLLVVELLGIGSRDALDGEKTETLHWSNELYPGEFDDVSGYAFLCEESQQLGPSKINGWEKICGQHNKHPEREVLQVYLTAWISTINIDVNRVADIFELVEDVMQVKLS